MWWAQLLNQIAAIHGTGAAAGGGTSYESIATVTVGSGGAASAAFTSIANTYKHLQIRYIGKCTQAGTGYSNLQIRFNSDSGTNYSAHELVGDGATVVSGGAGTDPAASQSQIQIRWPQTGGQFEAGVIDLLDYANSSKNKTLRALSGYDNNGSGSAQFNSGAWYSTSAITRIDILPKHGSIAQYSQFALYGIKG